MAERAMLRCLQGGCSSPIGVWSKFESEDTLRLRATVLHVHGTSEVTAEHAVAVSNDRAAEGLGLVVADMLLRRGAQALLSKHEQQQ
jgi:hydroxymethylbilane synthase